MRGPRRIDELYAFIVLDEDGTEGVPAFLAPGDTVTPFPTMMPMMGADLRRVEALRAIVRADPTLRGKRIIIAKFTTRTDVEVIDRTN